MAGLAVLVGLEWCKVKIPPAFRGTQVRTLLEEGWDNVGRRSDSTVNNVLFGVGD
jgi:hypothetical protein